MTSESDSPAGAEVWAGEPGPDMYANVLQVAGGPFDVTLIFGRQDLLRSQTPDESAPRSELVRISMSWAHLKAMIPLMASVVAKYEEQFGQIPSPGFDQQWKAE